MPCGIPFRAPELSHSSWTRSVRAEGCCKIRSRSPSASTRPVRVRPLQPSGARQHCCSVAIICNTELCNMHPAACNIHAAACNMHPAASNMREASPRGSPQHSLLEQACMTRKAMGSRRRWSGRWGFPAASVPGPGSPRPHLHRDRAHPCHICAGTGLTPEQGSPRDQARHRHICAGTRLISAAQCCSLQGKAIEVGSALKSGTDTLGSVFAPAT